VTIFSKEVGYLLFFEQAMSSFASIEYNHGLIFLWILNGIA